MNFLKGLIIKTIGFCEYHEEKEGQGFFYIPAVNYELLDVMNMFYSMGITFDYKKVTEVIPFVRKNEYFKLYNFRRVEE